MVDKNEALKLALEALQWNWGGEPLPTLELQAINAIKEALAQSESESDDLTAAYMSGVYDGKNKNAPQSFTYEQVKAHIQAALMSSSMPQLQTFTGENPFSPQREWVGLTDEEIAEIEDGYIVDYRIPAGCGWNFAKDIEAKLKEKNG